MVDILDHFGDVAFNTAGKTNQHRCTERFFIHETFVEPAMFTHIESLVGSINDNSIFQ